MDGEKILTKEKQGLNKGKNKKIKHLICFTLSSLNLFNSTHISSAWSFTRVCCQNPFAVHENQPDLYHCSISKKNFIILFSWNASPAICISVRKNSLTIQRIIYYHHRSLCSHKTIISLQYSVCLYIFTVLPCKLQFTWPQSTLQRAYNEVQTWAAILK